MEIAATPAKTSHQISWCVCVESEMERQLEPGQHVIFVDQLGQRHSAVVTHVFPWKQHPAYTDDGCNLVYVSGDANRNDSYGRQIERATSVIHKSGQPAHGFYWCWPNEL